MVHFHLRPNNVSLYVYTFSDAEDWFCECPTLYTGRLCQFHACERNPCGHGATCIPKSPLEAVCLCPYGRQGLLCEESINITRARFSGSDEFGYTSFVAYSSIPSLGFFYEFKLKFTLANNSSAVKDNLMLFAGHKGQGNDGDDFFVLGLRNGRVVHKFNLGSGIAVIVSDRLNHRINIHTVTFGRSKKTGWLKVDGQRNRTGSSPGPLVGLNVFNQLFVGGYNEYTPELLPLGSRFRDGFQVVTISDPFFSGNQSSWMSFPHTSIRHRTVLQLQFQPLSPDGILVYIAQHLSAGAGDFLCLSLTSGFVQLRFNLGDGIHILKSVERVDLSGRTWHTVKAGRFGHQGFLSLDNQEVRENGTEGMATLDVAMDIFVGGVSTLSFVSTDATEGEPMGFTGGLRELIVNGEEFELTETGAISGANVGDWDGTACWLQSVPKWRSLLGSRNQLIHMCMPAIMDWFCV
ncbi:hypothetical protein D5F01_LYC21093 [Larimichthys crocea]|uniref:Uncharacterized protein n=1 Tax=Larimichthys crocea TaxID=215358 RepID=A0A6G0HNC0_LARCR|nr:hypothetical protein D5F01_LYC21093 [Larimichthys crocea]